MFLATPEEPHKQITVLWPFSKKDHLSARTGPQHTSFAALVRQGEPCRVDVTQQVSSRKPAPPHKLPSFPIVSQPLAGSPSSFHINDSSGERFFKKIVLLLFVVGLNLARSCLHECDVNTMICVSAGAAGSPTAPTG